MCALQNSVSAGFSVCVQTSVNDSADEGGRGGAGGVSLTTGAVLCCVLFLPCIGLISGSLVLGVLIA